VVVGRLFGLDRPDTDLGMQVSNGPIAERFGDTSVHAALRNDDECASEMPIRMMRGIGRTWRQSGLGTAS
jgi:hypothetical protein